MRRIAVSQRVDVLRDRNERRDALDQNLCAFLAACGCLALPVPNLPDQVENAFRAVSWDGVLLSGGNDLTAYGGDAPERDATEGKLIDLARRQRLPLFGVCRGMQMIVHSFGGTLTRVEDHVARRHTLSGLDGGAEVNSFHTLAPLDVPDGFVVTARAQDGVVEAIRHQTEAVAGILWHPERNPVFTPRDVDRVKEFFGA